MEIRERQARKQPMAEQEAETAGPCLPDLPEALEAHPHHQVPEVQNKTSVY